MIHTDLHGDDHQVAARIHLETGERTVSYDLDHYTLVQARALAADIMTAVNHLDRRLLPVPQEPRCARCREAWGIRESNGSECLNCGLGIVEVSPTSAERRLAPVPALDQREEPPC